MRNTLVAVLLSAGLLACGSEPETAASESGGSASTASTSAPENAGPAAMQSEAYPLTTCAVSGEELGSMGEAVILQQPGREVALCCKACVKTYEADPAAYNKEIDAAIVAAQKPDYPLDTCLISGEVIGESDHMVPVDHVVGNRLYRLCCASCTKSLEKDLPKYRAEVLAAAAKQGE